MEIISWYYRLTIGLLAALMLMVAVVMMSARREVSNPFSAYLSGQESEVFSGITVNQNTHETSFWLRSNAMTLGDLILLWGKPNIRRYCDRIVVAWPARRITGFATLTATRRLSFFVPVQAVSFTRDGLPDWWKLSLANDAIESCEGS